MLSASCLTLTLCMGRQVASAQEDDREDAGIFEVLTDDATTHMLRLGAALEMAGAFEFAEVGSYVSRCASLP